MSVINIQPRAQYTYSTSSQYYTITFDYTDRSTVKCMVNDQELTYGTHYEIPPFDPISFASEQLKLHLLITPESSLDTVSIEEGDTITIYRETPIDQQAVFPQNAKFSSQKITEVLDKLTMLIQELDDTLSACVRLSKEAPINFDVVLPIPTANQVLQWNSEGTKLINYDLRGEINTISNTAASAVDVANSAASSAASAVSTANTAATNAASAVSTANTASTNASTALNTANTASTNASNAVNTANTASTNASNAVSTANTAATNASSALSKANTALSTANTAATNASNAVSTANTAATNASNAVNTANTAATNASNAVSTANTASTNASNAVSTANTAKNTADTASGKVDSFGEDIATVLAAAEKINELEEAVTTATTAAQTATNKASDATTAAQTATSKAAETTAAAASLVVDQTYDASSTHAQSGTAVAEALDTKQNVLTAGAGITIINGEELATPISTHLGVRNNWYAVAYGNDKYVAISYNGYVSTSTDGIDWAYPYNNILGDNYWIDVIYANGNFIAFRMNNSNIGVSSDGETWNINTSTSLGGKVTYDGTKYVMIRPDGAYVSTSTDGITWTTPVATQISSRYLGAFAYGNGKFVAIDTYGYVSTSTDGTTWSALTQDTNLGEHDWNGLAYDGTRFLAGGMGGYISTSTDGITWTEAEILGEANTTGWGDIIYNGSEFFLLGTNGYISHGNCSSDTIIKANVDQTYDASSTNAQSGTAVANAISTTLGNVENILYTINSGASSS